MDENIIWKSFSDNYECSSDGHIRNKRTGRILKEFLHKDGYLRTQFDGKSRTVHRVIATAFYGKNSDKPYVNHIDGNKQNNSAKNLEWCTFSENINHAYANGFIKPKVGTNNGRCKLTKNNVRYIKENYIKGDPEFGAMALSQKFGVAHQTICAIISGQNWKEEV